MKYKIAWIIYMSPITGCVYDMWSCATHASGLRAIRGLIRNVSTHSVFSSCAL